MPYDCVQEVVQTATRTTAEKQRDNLSLILSIYYREVGTDCIWHGEETGAREVFILENLEKGVGNGPLNMHGLKRIVEALE